MGDIMNITGNATKKAKPHAFNQIDIIFATIPTLKTLIKNDIIHDINNAIKNANTIL
jgi:hypothetical protein